MSEHDPRRLVADPAFAELEGGLLSARERAPTAEQVARMRAALNLPALPVPAASRAEPSGASVPVPSARFGGLKLIACGALVLAAAFGAWMLQQHAAVRVEGARETPHATAPVQTAPAVPPASAPQPAPAPTVQGTAGSSSDRAAGTHARRTAPRAVRSAPSDPAPSDPAGELALLKRAKADARSVPAHALALVAEHEQRFPNGVLVEEREVIAVEALLASGQRSASEARAARFFARFPNSAHARRVHALLGDDAPHPGTN